MEKENWIEIKSAGEIPTGTAVILKYRINGHTNNGINNQPFTVSDALRATGDGYKVEYSK